MKKFFATFKQPKMLLIALSIAINSCANAPVTVYDREYCADLGPVGAHCAHTMISKKRDIPKAQWDIERIGQLCSDPRVFTDTETAIEQFCHQIPCDYQERQKVEEAMRRLRPVWKKAHNARKKHFSEIQSVNPEATLEEN
jgi:hypothetical protein